MPFTREQWYEILLSFADDKACLSCYMCHIEKWLTRLGWQNFDFVLTGKPRRWDPVGRKPNSFGACAAVALVRRRRPSARILVIHLARGMALGRGGIDTRFWLDAALLPGGTWPLAGASKKNRSAIDRALDSKFLGWAYGQPQGVVVLRWPTLQEKGGRVWGGGRLPRGFLVELKLATLTEAGQLFCLVFENVPLVQTQGPLRQSHPYDWRSKKSVADRGDWASDFDVRVLTSFCCQRHCHSCFWLFSAYIQLPMLNHPNWALKT